MDITIHCSSCKCLYLGLRNNTKIIGPIVETTCPQCKKFILQNLGAFLEQQTKDIYGDIKKASCMIYLGQSMEKYLNEESPSSKRKKQRREKDNDISNI
jgi:hypothetical protein